MKKRKKIFALLCVTLTLITFGVSVYALQPPVKNPVSDTGGFWQNQRQDGGLSYTWSEYSCACGITLYALDIDHSVIMGDIINICSTAGTGQINYADCGIVADFTIDDPHEFSSHKYGQFLLSEALNDVIYTALSKPLSPATLVILVETRGASSFIRDQSFFRDNIVGSAQNTVKTYALVNTLTSIYDNNIYEEGMLDGYPIGYEEGYRYGYADGQINAFENQEAFDFIGAVIDGVSIPIIDTFQSISVFGVSLMSLLSFLVGIIVILLIIKVVRG